MNIFENIQNKKEMFEIKSNFLKYINYNTIQTSTHIPQLFDT